MIMGQCRNNKKSQYIFRQSNHRMGVQFICVFNVLLSILSENSSQEIQEPLS